MDRKADIMCCKECRNDLNHVEGKGCARLANYIQGIRDQLIYIEKKVPERENAAC